MGRKERRKLERQIKHLAKTKPWELQTIIKDTYGKDVISNRVDNDNILAPGDKVMINMEKFMADPEYAKFKPEYIQFAKENANKIFTLKETARPDGPFSLLSFVEDENNWMWYIGHLKKVG